MKKLKVLLVDHSVITRVTMLSAINATEYGGAERAASGGEIALEWLSQCKIDVIMIDVTILKKEGLQLIRTIKKDYPAIEVIVMSNHDPDSKSVTLDALREGALDFIQKIPEKDMDERFHELKTQMQELFAQILLKKFSEIPIKLIGNHEVEIEKRRSNIHGEVDLILIAASTGGPLALDKIFSTYPINLKIPVLIVQHMPPDFTKIMAQKLQEKYNLMISEGSEGEVIEEEKILVAPGGMHMAVEKKKGVGRIIQLLDAEAINGVKPSADVLFQSVANGYKGKNILVVVLTGMGDDGFRGVLELKKQCNCYCITQSEKTCVVYGMPKCVAEAGLSDEVADLDDIAFRIHQITRGGRLPLGH